MTWNSIREEVLSNIDFNTKNVLIQAGHFSILFNKEGNLIPAIQEEIQDVDLKNFVGESNYMNDFPFTTFKNGLSLAIAMKQSNINVKFAFIVNDWQWINKGLYAFQTERFTFYKKKQLPLSYETLLIENDFSEKDILKTNHYVEDSIYFSEHKLQKTEKKETVNLCSPNSCSEEYFPFLKMSLAEVDTLISFIPMLCKIPVLYSTINYISSQNHNVNIMHIFYDPHTKKIETSFLNKANLRESIEYEINEKYKIMQLLST
jgi:hypothetical protein